MRRSYSIYLQFNIISYHPNLTSSMATDDPRLNKLITNGEQGDIVIVGCSYDFLRKRVINKGGQDNGPCCLRRFYAKVGPLINPQYQIDISNLKVSDMGNISVEISKQEEQQQFKNVATRKFKGEFVNYYKHSPEKIMEKIGDKIVNLIQNNKLPFIFGGSKQGMMASIDAFHQIQRNNNKLVYILSGKPFLQRPYDGDKAASDNVCTILNMRYPETQFKVFGVHMQYFPSEYIIKGKNIEINYEKLKRFSFVTYEQIRKTYVKKQSFQLGSRTQGLHKFIEIFDQNISSQVHISLQVLEVFTGCRDLSMQGLQYDELTEIMMFLGRQPYLKSISINEFNPSCEDYESSLIILNALYYFLLGRAQFKKNNQ